MEDEQVEFNGSLTRSRESQILWIVVQKEIGYRSRGGELDENVAFAHGTNS